MTVVNWLALIMSVLNVAASAWEGFKNNDWRIAAIFFCYGITSFLFGVRFK